MDYVDYHGDYATDLQCLITHLVCFLLCFLPFDSTFMILMFTLLVLQVIATNTPKLGLTIPIFGEGDEANYVNVPLVPRSECPELLL